MLTSLQQKSPLPHLVTLACRILVDLRLDSGPFGNVSIRIPGTNQFWVNPVGITFEHIADADIVKADTEGNVLAGNFDVHPGEFIHRQIYRLRPDINAIVHTHSHSTVMMSLLGVTIAPYTQLGAAIFGDQGIYHGFSGPVRTVDEGLCIAQALDRHAIVMAKNHGLFATGQTMAQALWDMVVADQAAKIHIEAKAIGVTDSEPLSPELMHKSKIEVRDKQCQFMWDAFCKKVYSLHPELIVSRSADEAAG